MVCCSVKTQGQIYLYLYCGTSNVILSFYAFLISFKDQFHVLLH